MNISAVISQKGYIESVPSCRLEQKDYCPSVKKSSDEEIGARIVTTITPYLNSNISESEFLKLHSKIIRVLKDHCKECRKKY